MINFWHKNLHEFDDQGAALLKLPPSAKIQTGPSGEYPWADECERQVKDMGTKALAHLSVQRAMDDLRSLVVHDVLPIQFEARRKPKKDAITYINGGDLD